MNLYVFRQETRHEPGRKLQESELPHAVAARLPIGRGPWRFRLLKDGEVFREWGPWRRWYWARRRLVAILRLLEPGTTVQIDSKRGRDFRCRVVKLPMTTRAAQARAIALGLFGTPYVFGAADPETGFDCSGFVLWLVNLVTDGEVTLPHAARLIQEDPHLVKTSKPSTMSTIVLIWFPNDRHIPSTQASHVGFYDGPSRMIDARSPSDPLGYSPIDGHVIFMARIPEMELGA